MESNGSGYDMEAAAKRTAESPLARSLKGRHLQMIAIGGSIGTGLFVNSGKALNGGGPASLLIAFGIIGLMLYTVVHGLGELAVTFPVSGSFSTYSTRFIDPAWGFAMGWNYALQWLVVFPLELVAASITLQYWNVNVNNAVWVAIFWVVIVVINFFGVKGYGEAEFIFSMIKVIAVIGFIILGVVLVCGGGPVGGYIGGKYWHHPGAFNHGFKGLCSVFVTAAFAFAGTELVGLAAAETANPRKTLPTAVKQVFWRITLFYIVALTLVGLLVPYDNERLLGASSVDATASPFVIAITNAGISGLPSVMNVVIMIAVLSVGNSSIYGCSRTLASLAEMNQAPKILAYIDKSGRPLVGIIVTSIFGLLAFVSASPAEGDVFNWLLALSGLSSIFTWGSVCLAHILFRRAWKVQGHSLDELAFKSHPGVIGSYVGLILNFLVLVAQFWIAVWPVGGTPNASDFFMAYLAAPVVIAFYIFYKVWKRTPFVRPSQADLVSGRREVDIPALVAELATPCVNSIDRSTFLTRTQMSAESKRPDVESGPVVAVASPTTGAPASAWDRFVDSFRPNDIYLANYASSRSNTDGYDMDAAVKRTADSPLVRCLKGRHLQMIAIGGSIGTGLFVNSGKALSDGGPGALLIAFALVGLMLFTVVHALGELAVAFPVAGSFSTYSTRFIDPAWGFAMGWNYAMQWLVCFPLELVAASITLQYWHVHVNNAVWIAVFWVVIVAINLFGVKGYGEAEFMFSLIKVVAVIGFCILSIVLVCGGGPVGGYIGGKYWRDPGAFNHGFKGLCSVFVTAAFAFAGTELVGLAAAETMNPRKTLPSAVKQVFWRITLFYIVSLTLVGLLVPYNNQRLLGATSHVDAAASPFVIAIQNAGISGLPSVINVVILIAVLSVGNSAVYGCSRTLTSLSEMGLAPKFLSYIDKAGRPLAAVLVTSSFGLLAFISASRAESEIFNWLLALSGLSSIFTWSSVCLAHILFRRAWKVQGHTLEELTFRSQPGVVGSYLGLLLNILVLVAQFWIAVAPHTGSPNLKDFFQAYLAAPVVLVFFVVHKIVRKTKVVKPSLADVVSGLRKVDSPGLVEELQDERKVLTRRNIAYRVYKFWC
ncbi:general amino-acid permease GAP1 [Lipomyces orientalis]|uniref:General amino-acid permease GAP1 n=1 Tax=Lipomyces orientalis TaxID=1233043 RepID=A0ACC3TNR6_9ASCO